MTTSEDDLRRATDDLCAADPLMSAVRNQLARIDDWHTADGQWAPHAPRPVMYRLYANRDTNQVASEPLVILTAVLRLCTAMLNGNVPSALDLLSGLLTDPDSSPIPINDQMRHHINVALTEGTVPDGFQPYALGFASQAVAISADHPNAREIMDDPEFLAHPAVHAVFYTRALAVDSRMWDYVREQGQEHVCVTVGPDEPLEGDSDNNPLGSSLIRLMATMGQ